MCNNDHDACSRGVLPPDMLNCPTSYDILAGSNFNFVTFEMRDVDTFGKGKPYKTLVKVMTPLDYFQFLPKFRFRTFSFSNSSSLKKFLGLSSPPMLSTLLLPGSSVQLSWSFWTSKVSCATSSPWFPTLVRTFSWFGRWKQATSFFIGCKSVYSELFAPCQAAWGRTRRRQCLTSSPRTTSKVLKIFLFEWFTLSFVPQNQGQQVCAMCP